MRQRPVIATSLAVALCVLGRMGTLFAQVPVKPLRIVIMREETWPEVVSLSDCTLGKLYVVDTFPSGGAPVVFPGTPVGSVAEDFGALPFVYGTVVSSLLGLLIAVPLSIGTALFITEICPGRLRPGEVVDYRCGGLASGIGDLHVGAKTSLRHLTLAAQG